MHKAKQNSRHGKSKPVFSSGTRPADKRPGPASSGTSGSQNVSPALNHNVSGSRADELARVNQQGPAGDNNSPPPGLPDVPDGDEPCRTEVGGMPDGAASGMPGADVADPTVGEPSIEDGASHPATSNTTARPRGTGGERAEEDDAGDLADTDDEFVDDPPPSPWRIAGVLRTGPMKESREKFEVHEAPDVQQLLSRQDMPIDAVIEGDKNAQFAVLDGDAHHWTTRPTVEEAQAYLAALQPVPDACWVSHGHGLKAVYIGEHYSERARAAALRIPRSFTVELLRRTRHPRAVSSAHGGATCGPVIFGTGNPNAHYDFADVGRPSPAARDAALAKLGMITGGRYDHSRCPLSPGSSDAIGCVVVLESGVYCYRCAGHGIRHKPSLAAGFLPFSALTDDTATTFEELVNNRVHWAQALLQLVHEYPNIAPGLLRDIYEAQLWKRYPHDPRVPMVFNVDLDFVWGPGLWLDEAKLEPTQVDNDAISGLPYAMDVVEGEKKLLPVMNKVRRSRAKSRTPSGYVSVRPVHGISFRAEDGSIPVHVPPAPKFPHRLLPEPLPLHEALDRLEIPFPRLDRLYLQAALAAAICGEVAGGQPPMLVATGASGAGKEQTIRLAASFVGEDITKIALCNDEEAFARQIGIALTAGNRFLVFDEFGKTRFLGEKLKSILQISTSIQWRPLFQNRLVSTPTRAAFFFPCVRFPDFLSASAEFCRRTRRAHLYRRVPNWQATSGGDTVLWRDRTAENAFIANSVLTHIWRICRDHGFRFLP